MTTQELPSTLGNMVHELGQQPHVLMDLLAVAVGEMSDRHKAYRLLVGTLQKHLIDNGVEQSMRGAVETMNSTLSQLPEDHVSRQALELAARRLQQSYDSVFVPRLSSQE